jgi:hypothetical protein
VEDEFRSPSGRATRDGHPALGGADGPPILLGLALAFLAGFSAVRALQRRGGRVV